MIIDIYLASKLNIRFNHTTIGKIGDNFSTKLFFHFQEGKPDLSDLHFYLDIESPKGEKFKTSEIAIVDNLAEFTIPNKLLENMGKMNVEPILYGKGNYVFKYPTLEFQVLDSINATDEILEENPDFVAEFIQIKDTIKFDGEGDKFLSDSGDYKAIGEISGTTDYSKLENKPKINNVELVDNVSLDTLGIQPKGNYALESDIPEPYDDSEIKKDIEDLQKNKADSTEIPDISNFITKDVDNLTNYELKTNTGTNIGLSIDSTTFVMTLDLKNGKGDVLSTQNVDLPLETMVVNATYDDETKEIVLTLQNGNTTRFSVADLVSGLAKTSEIPTKVSELTNDSGFITDYNETDPTVPNYVKSITQEDITNWNNKLSSVPSNYPTTGDMNTAIANAINNSITVALGSDY